jgi:uncharacterized protein (TIGR02117 family)
MAGIDTRRAAALIGDALLWTVFGFAVALGGFFTAALAGMLIPANAGRAPLETGIRIYVEDNGAHTGIVIPARALDIVWDDLLRPGDLRDPRHAGHAWIAFGWGDRDFYMNTPRWADLSVPRTTAALAGLGDTVMHVEHIAEPRTGAGTRALTLSPEEFARLAGFIRASFAELPESWPGYANYDAFYAARGGYSLFRTCNEWTGAALRHAGVPMGIWTPLPASVMYWMPDP